MPTGVEEAGLIMAAFPLLAQLISEYHQGLDLIKRWMRYKRTLRSLRRVLAAEQQVFENACYKLFDSVFSDNGYTARRLFGDCLGSMWKDVMIEQKLKSGLGPKNWEVFQGIMSEIQGILSKLLVELQKNIPVNQSTRLHAQLIALSARFHIVFGRQEASMEELHRLIDIFQNLTEGIKIRRREMSSVDVSERYYVFRQKACELSDIINQSFQCSCTTQHVANMRLGALDKKEITVSEDELASPEEEAFNIEFQSRQGWKATCLQPRSTNHPGTCHPINDLCVRLQDACRNTKSPSCLGYISSGPLNSDSCYCIKQDSLPTERSQVMSLYQLLSSTRRHSRFPFYERDRLKLAIILTTSLLRLYSTPWLQDMWTSRDILFRPLHDDFDEEAVLQPYVAHRFPCTPTSRNLEPPPMVRNATLYALGKVLIQLIEGQPLVDDDQLSKPMSTVSGHVGVDPEQQFAAELEPTIYRKAGSTWAEVVRRCLYCEFDVETAAARLDNEEFFRRVYALVIKPLVEALQRMGEPL